MPIPVFISLISPQVGTGLSIDALGLTPFPALKRCGSLQKSAAFCLWTVGDGAIWGIGADIYTPHSYSSVRHQGTNPGSKRAWEGGRALANLCLLCSLITAVAFSRVLGSWRLPRPSNPDHSCKSGNQSVLDMSSKRIFSSQHKSSHCVFRLCILQGGVVLLVFYTLQTVTIIPTQTPMLFI